LAGQEREGYIYVGDVGVDSAMIVIGDPALILPRTKDDAGSGYKPSLDDVTEALKETRGTGFIERPDGDTVAVAFRSGYGDGSYPVFCKLDENGRVVEVVVDMAMTDFQRKLFGM